MRLRPNRTRSKSRPAAVLPGQFESSAVRDIARQPHRATHREAPAVVREPTTRFGRAARDPSAPGDQRTHSTRHHQASRGGDDRWRPVTQHRQRHTGSKWFGPADGGRFSQAKRLDQVEDRAREAISLMLDVDEDDVGDPCRGSCPTRIARAAPRRRSPTARRR
jgi:hypothetical protein